MRHRKPGTPATLIVYRDISCMQVVCQSKPVMQVSNEVDQSRGVAGAGVPVPDFPARCLPLYADLRTCTRALRLPSLG